MTDTLQVLSFQLAYLTNYLSAAEFVDIGLVTLTFFLIFHALRQTRAYQLLRGAIIFATVGVTLLIVLPFNTFRWLLGGLLLAGVVALPVLFQDELRRAFTGLGQLGRRRIASGTRYDRFKSVVLAAVHELAQQRMGALMVMEGNTPLNDIIDTGIPVQAEALTAELLLTIFYPKTPLHDGAVVFRGDQLVAASCILPVQAGKTGKTHLGTRHRAALGLSNQILDALVLIVSEETGQISIATGGRLRRGVTEPQIEAALDRFRDQLIGQRRGVWQWLLDQTPQLAFRNLLLALGLAMLAWVGVVYQTNPPLRARVSGIPLARTGPAENLVLVSELPATVEADIQVARAEQDLLNPAALSASLSLENLPEGVHRIPVQISLPSNRAQVLSVNPGFVTVRLEPLKERSLSLTVRVLDPETLPPGYVLGDLRVEPDTVTVRGARSAVDTVAEALIEVQIRERRGNFQERVEPQLLNEAGQPVENVHVIPTSVQVSVPVLRTFHSREIGIRAVIQPGTLEPGYQITQIQIEPPQVTLTGSLDAITAAGDQLETLPIDLRGVLSELTLDVPLVLPAGVTALDENGAAITSVEVRVGIAPTTEFFVLSLSPRVLNLREDLSLESIAPQTANVLLTGPQPLIDEIRSNASLVELIVDLKGLDAGTHVVLVDAMAPDDLQVEVFPQEVTVVLVSQ